MAFLTPFFQRHRPTSIVATALLIISWLPSTAQDASRNYVLSRSYQVPLRSADQPLAAGQVQTSIEYVDGLGRPQQRVQVQASPNRLDLVAPQQYDNLGRPVSSYLPAPTASQVGSFQPTAPALASDYYSNSSRFAEPTGRSYTESGYEASPLERIRTTTAAGTDKAVTRNYGVNSQADLVRRYQAGTNLTDISRTGYYGAGQLTSVQTTDESSKQVIDFTDKQGLLVLHRAGTGGLITNTYYAYDDRNQLRAVLQPRYELLDQPTADQLALYAFLYHYDERGRLDSKQVPGGYRTTYSYDSRDQLKRTVDAKGFAINTDYDELNRPIRTYTDAGQELTRTYYDSYQMTTVSGTGQALQTEFPFQAGLTTYPWTAEADFVPSDMTNAPRRGLVTGQCVRLIQDDGSLSSLWDCQAIYYDDRQRVVQTVRRLPYLGSNGLERISYRRDFGGKVVAQKTTHSWDSQRYTVEKQLSYDQAERLTGTRIRTSSASPGALPEQDVVISAQRYNEVGQLAAQYLHAQDEQGKGAIEQFTYQRNVRGWLREHKGVAQASRPYRLGLTYQPNGNIDRLEWQYPTAGSAGYSFTYDELNRLTSGHGEELSYDLNGNIQSLKRTDPANTLIDNLTFTYGATDVKGNQLQAVTDRAGNGAGFSDGNTSGDDYSYDPNGNLIQDKNRGISSVSYNYLNLPARLVVGGQTLSYIYDASGQKRKLSVSNGGESTLYEGAFEYSDGGLPQRISTEEGQFIKVGSSWQWQYYVRDHLNNVRLVLDGAGQVVQETDYYPFGLAIAKNPSDLAQSRAKNKYLYLNRELQPVTGWLDLKARFYDPAIGRFLSVDPLTDQQEHLTPYHYGYNNPVRFADPDGKIGDDCCGDALAFGKGVGTGLYEGVKGTVTGLINTVAHPINTINGITDAIANYEQTGAAIKTAAVQTYDQLSNGSPQAKGEVVGKALALVAEAVVGTKGLGKIGAASKLGETAEVAASVVKTEQKIGSLANPFKGKTLQQVQEGLEKQVQAGKLKPAYTDPVSGSKSYVNPKSKYSYNIDTGLSGKTGMRVEPPHVDVNYPNPKPKNISPKRKFFLE